MPVQTPPPAGPAHAPLELENIPALKREVRALAEERGAVILAHNYQVPEVQDVAHYVATRSDSPAKRRRPAAT